MHTTHLPSSIFRKISSYIQDNYGIQLPPEKKTMVEGRIRKRMKDTGIQDFTDYFRFAFSKAEEKKERIQLVNAITTNKTHFFRESAHFDFLKSHLSNHGGTPSVWSAGCSTGEEVYTLAIILSELSKQRSIIDFAITGTDLSTRVLDKAANGVYPEADIAKLPLSLKQKYFLKSKDRKNKTVKLAPALRKKLRFKKLNFMDSYYGFTAPFDIIFCRNVLIYFDKTTQTKVLDKLAMNLAKGGILILGHSESMPILNPALVQLKPTIYQKNLN